MKKRNYLALGVAAFLSAAAGGVVGPVKGAHAEGNCFSANGETYAEFSEARNVAYTTEDRTVTLVCDASITDTIYGVNQSLVFDLNGHTFSQEASSAREMIRVLSGGTLTIKDSSEAGTGKMTSNYFALRTVSETTPGGVINVESGIVEGQYALVNLQGGVVNVTGGEIRGQVEGISISGGTTTMSGGEIHSDSVGIDVAGGGTLTMSGEAMISAAGWGVTVFGDSTFTMNGGTIHATGSDAIGVSGNGTTNPEAANYGGNAKAILNSGRIIAGNLGVYAPQVNGETILGEGLSISAGKAGVEVRAGELTVNGATIEVEANAPYNFNPNGNGSTASGVAIAVAQHTTTMPINARVLAGRFIAPVVFAESNPQQNEEEDIEKVEVAISGGEFNATNGDPIVASEDKLGFITGGTFNKIPGQEYVAQGYTVYELGDEGPYVVDEQGTLGSVANGEIYIEVKKSEEVEPATVLGGKYATYGTFGLPGTVASYKDGVITAGDESGEAVLNFNSHDVFAEQKEYNLRVVVYDVEELMELDGEADAEGMRLEVAMGVLSEEEYEAYKEQADEMFSEGKVAASDNLATVYEAWLDVYKGNSLVAEAREIAEAIEMEFELPGWIEPVKAGYKRTWYVVRQHWTGEEYVYDRLSATVDGETVRFSSDKFSYFALYYYDEVDVSAPDTGRFTAEMGESGKSDKSMIVNVLGMIAGMALAGAVMVEAYRLAEEKK